MTTSTHSFRRKFHGSTSAHRAEMTSSQKHKALDIFPHPPKRLRICFWELGVFSFKDGRLFLNSGAANSFEMLTAEVQTQRQWYVKILLPYITGAGERVKVSVATSSTNSKSWAETIRSVSVSVSKCYFCCEKEKKCVQELCREGKSSSLLG